MRRRSHLGLALAGLVLGACATAPPPQMLPPRCPFQEGETLAALAARSYWVVEGWVTSIHVVEKADAGFDVSARGRANLAVEQVLDGERPRRVGFTWSVLRTHTLESPQYGYSPRVGERWVVWWAQGKIDALPAACVTR